MIGIFDVLPTARTETFMVNFNEQPDGSMMAIGFSLTGDVIDPGTGSIILQTLAFLLAAGLAFFTNFWLKRTKYN